MKKRTEIVRYLKIFAFFKEKPSWLNLVEINPLHQKLESPGGEKVFLDLMLMDGNIYYRLGTFLFN